MIGDASASTATLDNSRDRIIAGLGANVFGKLIFLGSRLILAPLFLRAWGVERYGEWLIVSSVVAYLTLMDMGSQLYIVNRLTQAFARDDIATFRRVLHTGLALLLVVPATGYLLFLVAIFIPPVASLLDSFATDTDTIRFTFGILAFQYIFSFPQGILLGVYRSVGLLPRGVMLFNLILLLQLVLTALGLLSGAGMPLVAALHTLPYLLIALVALRELNRRFPQIHITSLREANVATIRRFVRPSLQFLLINAALVVSAQGLILVVGSTLGAAVVVVFTTHRIVSGLLRQMLSTVPAAIWPELTRLDARGDYGQLFTLFRAVVRSTMVAAAMFATAIHFFGGTVYAFWLGGYVAYHQVVMDLLLTYALQAVFWTVCSNLLMATNNHRTLSVVLFIGSVLTAAATYVGGVHFGLVGALTGMLAGDAVLVAWVTPHLVRHYLVRATPAFFLTELWPIAAVISVSIVVPWMAIPAFILLFVWWTHSLSGTPLALPWHH